MNVPSSSSQLLCCIQHHKCSKHVCLYKHFRILNASVNMALRSKMNHSLDIIFSNSALIASLSQISAFTIIIRLVFNVFQVLKISRISQFVYINDLNFVTIFSEHIMDIVGADKSRSFGYQVSRVLIPPFYHFSVIVWSL